MGRVRRRGKTPDPDVRGFPTAPIKQPAFLPGDALTASKQAQIALVIRARPNDDPHHE
jgi:hypothetical protein